MNMKNFEKTLVSMSEKKIANLFVLDIYNEHGCVPLIFDAGAGITVINQSTAKLFNAKKLDESIRGAGNAGVVQEMNLYIVEELKIGSLIITSLKVVVVDDEVLDFGIDEEGNKLVVSGFLGWDVISQFKWSYNTNRNTMLIEDVRNVEVFEDQNMLDWNNMPLFWITINGENKLAGLDTGNTESILGNVMYKLIESDIVDDEFQGIDGNVSEQVKVYNELVISIFETEVTLYNIPCVDRPVFPIDDNEVAGLIGADILAGMNWSIDYKNRTFWLKK